MAAGETGDDARADAGGETGAPWGSREVYSASTHTMASDRDLRRPRVFYSYAREDERLLAKLKAHLEELSQQGLIESFDDGEILGGEDWNAEIKRQIEEADIILLLVTAEFLRSPYIRGVEMKRAFERHAAGDAVVVSIIARPVDLTGSPVLGLHVLPRDAKPVTKWSNRDEAWTDVAKGIRLIVEKRTTPKQSSPKSARLAASDTKVDSPGSRRLFSPLEIASLYGFPKDLDGTGQCIGFIHLGGGYLPADITSYAKGMGRPEPVLIDRSVGGATNQATSGASELVTLCLQVAVAIAPRARMLTYFAPNTDRGLHDAVTAAIGDDENPSVLSISWGAPESQWTLDALRSLNTAFQAAVDKRITICCAAGDRGFKDGIKGGSAHVDFPASSPYVLGCGGTRLTATATAISDEVVWGSGSEFATGGGVSDIFPLPPWQAPAGVPESINPGKRQGRGVPDVAAHADPSCGYRFLFKGHATAIGGTAVATPVWACFIALLNQGVGSRLGYFNPLLYQALGPAGAFRDIVQGNNGGYSARPGWDPCTGWGSPDAAKLLVALRALKSVSAL